MSSNLLLRINTLLQRIENCFPLLFGPKFRPGPLYAVVGPSTDNYRISEQPKNTQFSLKDLIGDGFLWAVPKHRRTIEKRWKRKYGSPEYILKILQPKSNLRVCNQCGHDHEVGILCPHCYKKVCAETEQIQEKINAELGLKPIEEDVIVLYDGEKGDQPAEFWKGKRIVEMKKPRPHWFSKNLLQKTTQPAATTKEVKPSELG